MKRLHLLMTCFLASIVTAQTANYSKAPNSYIFDIDQASAHNYGGLLIPVKKAYKMWANYQYLKTNGTNTPIPDGEQQASIYWEDVPGLISQVSIVSGATPEDAKMKVEINAAKGKGNAVVAFKVGGVIYWSWHIWVTDNPTNGVSYSQGFETDINMTPVQIEYMDRNLGAVSNSFLNDQWQKSGGLMYEWGRKDPFPPLVNKDGYFYEITGEVGALKHKQIDPVNTIPVVIRPFDEIEKNIQYSVQNPIKYIINTDATGNWFSNSRYRIDGAEPDYVTWDLWADNAKGGNSNANSSNTALKNESRSYELKSELDPCPNGWRVPSYYGRITPNNNLSFFGKHDWNNDDSVVNLHQVFPNQINANLDGIKVYPGLGMDFTNAQGGARNIGIISNPGAYVYYPNPNSPNSPVGIMYQDSNANGAIWSATFGFDGARVFSLISDANRTTTSVGLHAIFNNQTHPTRSGNAVKCIKDPNLAQIGNFVTEYFVREKENYRNGLENPNSYVVVNEPSIEIPVNKAFSVYNQLLTDHESRSTTNLIANLLWTTNPAMITNVKLQLNAQDPRESVIMVQFAPGETGNAVISLHSNNNTTPAYWSWHIWKTASDPTENAVTYTTETPISVPYNFVNPTKSQLPPLQTVFMDRNLGAEDASLESGISNGLHYQWGRKDPIPSFANPKSQTIYLPGFNNGGAYTPNSIALNEAQYAQQFTQAYGNYGSQDPKKAKKIEQNIKYAAENPLVFLYQQGLGAIYDGGNHFGNDLSKVRDWASDERSQADNRWGHSDKKSPFDPCPSGWRVPDVTFANLYSGSKGSSPWYNGYKNDAYGKLGVIQDQWHDVVNYYEGQTVSQGWKFPSTTFQIGNFPKDGMRGELGDKNISYERSGVWTASLADLYTGFALSMQFQGNKMQTGTGAYPQAGMSVRCAKEEKRLLGLPLGTAPTLDVESVTQSNSTKSEIQLFPNPFAEEFHIGNADVKSFEIYDFSGKLLLAGVVNNGIVNAAALQKGVYLVKIQLKNGKSVSRKIIKN